MFNRDGRDSSELDLAIRRYKSAFITVGILSAVLNVLLLGGSIYMMLIYDSVLPSHSVPTLVGLFAMVTVVYLFQALFDILRTRILGDVAGALDGKLSHRVQQVISEASLRGARLPGDGLIAMRDLDQIRSFLAGPGPSTLMDLPWIVFFLGILFLLHVWLGVAALVGAIILLFLAYLTDRSTKEPTARLSQVQGYRNGLAESNLRHVEILAALGMRRRMQDRFGEVNRLYQNAQMSLARTVGILGGGSRVFRMLLQSIILTVGALLVINGDASGGVIFAASLLSGRALAPVDQAIGNWRNFASARLGWERLGELLRRVPAPLENRTILPRPSRELSVDNLAVVPPGAQQATVGGITFKLEAGSALGIIGPSAAGKSSLGRALINVWQPARGSVRLDGATLDQWDADVLGSMIGYLPQTVELLEGTIAENIARFEPDADSANVVKAAQAAGVHDMIVRLPRGYETPVGFDGGSLSSGQRQRIGLARALYGDPFVVLLDEPNSNLDAEGEAALGHAIRSIRERGGIAIVIAHRPSAIGHVNYILFLRDGRMEAFGPRDEVLKRSTNNAQSITPPTPRVGVAAASGS